MIIEWIHILNYTLLMCIIIVCFCIYSNYLVNLIQTCEQMWTLVDFGIKPCENVIVKNIKLKLGTIDLLLIGGTIMHLKLYQKKK